jgi:acyl-CoA synthetase (AMP-forming)/AMP-acid ligase II
MLINEFLEKSARKFPDKNAVGYKQRWMTYSELEKNANSLANFLIDRGIKRSDRIAILLENSFDYVISYYGVLKTGAITVELNTENEADNLRFLLNDCEARVLIVQKKFMPLINEIAADIPSLETVLCDSAPDEKNRSAQFYIEFEQIFQNYDTDFSKRKVIDVDIASIVYTSGSTGTPKGVVLSHLNIVANTQSIVKYLEISPQDRIMVILPFFYVYGKSLLNTHFYSGGSVVLDNRFTFPNAILDTMKKTDCTGFAGVPSTFSILLNNSSIHKWKFPSLRYVTQAGGAMAPAIQKKVAQVFSPAQLYVMYGATEASARLSYLSPNVLEKKWGSIGKAIPNVELFVADDSGKPLPPNGKGEIVARGSNIMQGYWRDEKETSIVLKRGLYFTGDLGRMDEEGYIYIVGRKKDMIKVGANRISPKEIEEKLLENSKIHEIAVLGVEDEILGEAIKAFVVLRNSNNNYRQDEILSYCKKRLPPYKIPKYIEIVNSLPKNSSGKILKQRLRDKNIKIEK